MTPETAAKVRAMRAAHPTMTAAAIARAVSEGRRAVQDVLDLRSHVGALHATGACAWRVLDADQRLAALARAAERARAQGDHAAAERYTRT
jgi:hypothetical protein